MHAGAVQIQLMDMVYRKALRLSSGEVAARGAGGVVNLQTNDVNKLERLPVYMHGIWEGPLQVLVSSSIQFPPSVFLPLLPAPTDSRHQTCRSTPRPLPSTTSSSISASGRPDSSPTSVSQRGICACSVRLLLNSLIEQACLRI